MDEVAELHGGNLIGHRVGREGTVRFRAVEPSAGRELAPDFVEATPGEVDEACRLAAEASPHLADAGGEARAVLLERIAEEIEALGEALVARTAAETGLPAARLVGERGRTTTQLRMFAELAREGSWVDARLDRADPDRRPAPKPDVRRMRVALGPVAVFGASNFPLAFSVAGGDTASALAAGCPVVAKAHPAHPGASELVGRAIARAVAACGLPAGTFSLVHGRSHRVGQELATHPVIEAVGFTGSFAGGVALMRSAAARPRPIPVFAEMGSSNPVFVLPEALAARGEAIADGLAASVTLGAGQFCTNPGLVMVETGPPAERFADRLRERLAGSGPLVVVHRGIRDAYDRALDDRLGVAGVVELARSEAAAGEANVVAALLAAEAKGFSREPGLQQELYGPATMLVRGTAEELMAVARGLHGHLTATVHGTDADLDRHGDLLRVLRDKVGRLVVNGFPTGVEVGPAMHHGGPWPATTDPRFTSVGTAAIERFSRPVCFQDLPGRLLPPELADANPRRISRLVDGVRTREPLGGS